MISAIEKKIAIYQELLHLLDQHEVRNIFEAVSFLHKAGWESRRVFVIGNGGSASTAQHFAADLNKWASKSMRQGFRAICLCENLPLISAIVNDDGWDYVYVNQLKSLFVPGDVLVCFSVHGGTVSSEQASNLKMWSGNLLKAVEYVKKHSGQVLSFSGYGGGALKEESDVCIVAPVDITAKENTPYVESMHSFLAHLIVDVLREVMQKEMDGVPVPGGDGCGF